MKFNTNYLGCGCRTEIEMDIVTKQEIDTYLHLLKGISGKCPECQEIDRKYGFVNHVVSGDYDERIDTYVFFGTDIRNLVNYCYIKGIILHGVHYGISSPYDCSGECFGQSVKVTRGSRFMTISVASHYDL